MVWNALWTFITGGAKSEQAPDLMPTLAASVNAVKFVPKSALPKAGLIITR